MTRNLLILLFALLGINVRAQVSYDSGYFVSNNGQKTICLIKNFDWHFCPTEFLYKITVNETARKAGILDVKEFGIFNFSRYERYDVQVDTSAQETGDMDANPRPEYKRITVFLKVLVQGKATLYVYREGNLTKYYYKIDSTEPTPLIHKIYYSPEDQSKINENNVFRNQLYAALQSAKLEESSFSGLSYKENSLTSVFNKYNNTQHAVSQDYVPKLVKTKFNLNLRVGTDLSSLDLQYSYNGQSTTPFGNKVSATFGLETEFIMPFNRNKWSVVLQPSYHYYKSDIGGGVSADYKEIEFGLGVREYFFIGKNSKLFATALLIFGEPLGSEPVAYGTSSLDSRYVLSGALSGGYKFGNRCSLEAQYTLTHGILDTYVFWRGEMHRASLVFAYTIL